MLNPSLSEQVSDDLVENLLEDDPSIYPWNPANPNAEQYFTEQEESFSLTQCFETDELMKQSETFFSELKQCWDKVPVASVETLELEKFRNLVPSFWLEKIITQANQLITDLKDPLSQLVYCVKPLFPHWTEEDLQIRGRQYAYALRSKKEHQQIPWDKCSEIQKIDLAMEVAQAVFKKIQKT